MATVMWSRVSSKVNACKLYRNFTARKSGHFFLGYSTSVPSTDVSDSVQYPPIKPRWPPGKWAPPLTEKVAWQMHDKGNECLEIPNVKERLEKMAGEKQIPMYKMEVLDTYPSILDYKQYMTKTHLAQGLPDVYKTAQLEAQVADIVGILETILKQEIRYQQHAVGSYELPESKNTDYNRHRLVGQILNCVLGSLAYKYHHLLRSQFDESVRIESFWWRAGFQGAAEKPMRHTSSHGMVRMQGLHKMDYQIRTEMPLPEFIPADHEVCTEGEIPTFDHAPSVAGQKRIYQRPITVSGHWIGDPCEFGQLGVTVQDSQFENSLQWQSPRQQEEKMVENGLVSGFLSCLAQAHNQGFNLYHDVTFPFTTQTLVTNGQWFQFFAYQLNTLQIWIPDEVHSLRNVCWASNRMKLYDIAEDGEVTNINADVVRYLVQFLVLEPIDRGIELRPYLPEEEAPVKKRLYINHVGDEPLEHPVIGRFQYTRNPVYF